MEDFNANLGAAVVGAIQEYQCPGCITGSFPSCFAKSTDNGLGCGNHRPATYFSGVGKIFLGLPKGFHRLGPNEHTKIWIFQSFEEFDIWNRPVWKHLNAVGHTLVRVFVPRINDSQIYIFLEDCLDRIDCVEITAEQIEAMD